MPSPTEEKKLTRKQADAQIALLTDRLAISLMLLKQRHGGDWNPWFGEGMWREADGLGEIMRLSSEYPEAIKVVKLFITRSER